MPLSLKRTASIIRKSVDAALDRHNARIVSLSMTHNKLLNVIADSVAADLAPKAKAGKKAAKAAKTSAKGTVVNGTRFTDPATKLTYAAGSKEARGKWLCTGVKKTDEVDTFTEKFIIKNRTKFQPARAR